MYDCKAQCLVDGLSQDDSHRAETQVALPHLNFNLELLTNLAAVLGMLKHLSIAHNDLKPCNIFIVRRTDADGITFVEYAVIADMGMAKDIIPGKLYMKCPLGIGGTLAYTAPEVFPYNDYVLERGDAVNICSFAADMYAFGLVIVHVLEGVLPYAAALVPELIYLAQDCLDTEPAKRPTILRALGLLFAASQYMIEEHKAADTVDCIMECAENPSPEVKAAHGKMSELAAYTAMRLTLAEHVNLGTFVAYVATFKDADSMIGLMKSVFESVGCGSQLRWYLQSVAKHHTVKADDDCLQAMIIEIY